MTNIITTKYNVLNQEFSNMWAAYNGDSTEVLCNLPDNSIDFSVGSPPFIDLYTYTATERDLGNSKLDKLFYEHYGLIVNEKLRITKPGRVSAVHTQNVWAQIAKDGWRGLKDFPGEVIRLYENAGWIWWGDIHIDKNPQALMDGTKVLTPNGWKEINNLSTEDSVIGSDGNPTRILGVYPHEKRRMYKITFSDGESIKCDGNHLWTVKSYNTDWKTIDTVHLFETYLYKNGKPKYEIPISSPVEFENEDAEFTIHPYTLGVLLGDGHLCGERNVSVTTQDEIVYSMPLPNGCQVNVIKNTETGNGEVHTFSITHPEWHYNPVLNAIRNLGLYGSKHNNKFIPEKYLKSSIESRIELLRGLMDSDGTIKKNNSSWFTTTSRQLANDVKFIVRSLGGFVSESVYNSPKYTYKGQIKTGMQQYVLCIRFDNGICPFKIKHKVDRWSKPKAKRHRKIKNIEVAEESTCTCITVENEDGLFVAENFIVTHNSIAIRLKVHELMFKTLAKDSSKLSPSSGDRVLIFKKPGSNEVPVTPIQNGEMNNENWIEWAHYLWPEKNMHHENSLWSPIEGYWYDINETLTLQHKNQGKYYEGAKSRKDVKHSCPLQLETIERLIKMYSNPGEIVLDEFAGIFSTPYMANLMWRKSIGIELKPEWYERGVKNMHISDKEKQINQNTLFSLENYQ